MTTPLETVELRDERHSSRALLAPGRGGMVTRFEVGGTPVLYLDEGTLLDPAKNVRGGNPVLFPSPGPLAGERFTWRGRTGSMKQHGFARQRPWHVVSSDEREATLELRTDEVTRQQFPFDFVLRFRHVLDGATLRIEQRIENVGREPMPFAAGFHPYFRVADADKARASIPTNATRAFDNTSKRIESDVFPIDLSRPEVDLHLLDHTGPQAELRLPNGGRVLVTASEEYRRWIVWTLAGKDFVCLEPWTALADALNRDDDVLVVEPGGARDLWVEFALARP